MSHELRTPLNGIIGFSELLEAEHFGPLNAQQRTYVEHIVTSGRHLLQLVNDVLDLSKLETGRVTLQREWSSIDSVIEGVGIATRRGAQERKVRVEPLIAADLPAMFIDPMRIQQAVTNLVLNALKRVADGGNIEISVSTTGTHVRIAVKDDGPVIAARDFPRVFLSAEQRDGRDRSERGLGLALTRRLIDMHSGSIEMESTAEGGTIFCIVLSAEDPLLQRHSSAPPLVFDTDEQIVLVVDDDPRARELIAGELRAAGITVVFARNAEEAIELASVMHPEAITLDIHMPGVDGFSALQHLKRSSKTMAIPVIVISIGDETHRARRLGAADFLLKPVTKMALLSAVDRAGVRLHQLEGVKVMLLDRDNPHFDPVESRLRRAGCHVTRPGSNRRTRNIEDSVELVVLDGAAGGDEMMTWLEDQAVVELPLVIVGNLASVARASRIARQNVAHTTLEEIADYPERLVRALRALIDERTVTARAHEGRSA